MNKYSVERVVGEGSFGKALLCRRKSDNRKCIVKEISLSKMSRKEAKSTEQEASLLARLHHPNIVTFWEAFQESKGGRCSLYIVMDFADGGDLSTLIKGRRNKLMSESQVVNITVQVSLALKHVHDRKILHRDLKCANIFLTSSGIVKLGDFGIAKVLRNTGELASTQIGTPYFMSPEILGNHRYNNKTDIWSLGCVVFELMCLRVPFEGSSMKQLVSNIINRPTPPLPAQYSVQLKALVKAMLAKNYRERPSINSVLAKPIMRERITNILDDHVRRREFSHTVLHGDDILTAPQIAGTDIPTEQGRGALISPRSVPTAPHAAAVAPSRVIDRGDAQQRQAEANAAALAQARERQGQKERERLRENQAKAQDALEIARKRRAERERNERLIAQSREEQARVEREEIDRKIALQMEKIKVMKAAHHDRDMDLKRLKQAAEEREAYVKQKAKEAQNNRDKEQLKLKQAAEERDAIAKQKAKEAREFRDKPRREDRKKDAPPNFMVMGEKEPVRMACAAPAVAPPGDQYGRFRPRMKPSVPRQQPRNVKAHSPPQLSPRPRLGGAERQAVQRKDSDGDIRVQGNEQKEPIKVFGAHARPSDAPTDAAPDPGIAGHENKVDMSAAQERRRKFELLRAKALLKQPDGQEENSAASGPSGVISVPVSERANAAAASEVAALDDGPRSSSSDEDVGTEDMPPASVHNMREKRGQNADRLKNFEQQMGVLQNILSDLSPSSNSPPNPFGAGIEPKAAVEVDSRAVRESPPPLPTSSAANKPKKSRSSRNCGKESPCDISPPRAVTTAEEQRAQRRQKRDNDRRNLRDFVAAQRKAQGIVGSSPSPDSDISSANVSPSDSSNPSPSLPPRCPSSKSRSPVDPTGPNRIRARIAGSNLKDDFYREGSKQPKRAHKPGSAGKVMKAADIAPKGPPLSAEELRRKRDAERVDLRRMIAAKRSEKAALMKQRVAEREEIYARRAQQADDLAKAKKDSGELSTGDEARVTSGQHFPQSHFLISGGNADTPEEFSDVHEEQIETEGNMQSYDASIRGEDSVDPEDAEEGDNAANEEDDRNVVSDIPDYVTAEVLRAHADMLLPPDAPAVPGKCEVEDSVEREVRFRDFLGRDYTPLNTGVAQNPRPLVISSKVSGSTIRYSQDDIDVNRMRVNRSVEVSTSLSSTCCSRISSLFLKGDSNGTSSRRQPVRRSNSSVSPAPDDKDDGGSQGSERPELSSDEADVMRESCGESAGECDLHSESQDEEFGSMLLAMEDALCLSGKQLRINADGVEEDDDVFEDESDTGDEVDVDASHEEFGGTGSSWENYDDGNQKDILVSDICVETSPSRRKEATPLYAYAALGGKLSPPADREPSESPRAIDDNGVVVTDPRGDDIIRLAENMLSRNIRELENWSRADAEMDTYRTGDGERAVNGVEGEESSMGSSWASGSDGEDDHGDSQRQNDMTIYGVPFPLSSTVRNEIGIEFAEDDSAALKMEALREYLEDSLGLDKFIKAYRLLKSIGPRDDDDSLLTNMEHIVGVEGLQYMDTFIQLITIEERFESN